MDAKTLRRAAHLLEEDVVVTRHAVAPTGKWPPGTREARNKCYEKIKLARDLRDMAKAL